MEITSIQGELVKQFESNINAILDFMTRAPQRLKELEEELSMVDRELSDVKHYIEFIGEDDKTGFNGVEGFYLAKELQILLRRRRKIKNETEELNSTYTRFSCSIGGIEKVNNLKKGVTKSIIERQGKWYTPKARPEMFDRIKHKVKINN